MASDGPGRAAPLLTAARAHQPPSRHEQSGRRCVEPQRSAGRPPAWPALRQRRLRHRLISSACPRSASVPPPSTLLPGAQPP